MNLVRVLSSILLLMGTAGAAEPKLNLDVALNACVFKHAIERSPDHYLIAVTEYIGDTQCTGKSCLQEWSVKRLISYKGAGKESTPPSRFASLGLPPAPTAPSKGQQGIGIYVPGGANMYLASMVAYTVTPEVEEAYSKAAAMAVDPGATLDCTWMSSPSGSERVPARSSQSAPGSEPLPWSYNGQAMDGYSITLDSITPAPGTPLMAGSEVTITASVTYKMTIATRGVVGLFLMDDQYRSVGTDDKQVFKQVSTASGSEVLNRTLSVPGDIRELHILIPIVPQGLTRTSGEINVRYPVVKK
jgi:hypothetical protein